MRKIIILIMIVSFVSFVSAFDNETFQICGGDSETIILCVGDGENSPIGLNIFEESGVTPPTGGPGTGGGGVRFNITPVCHYGGLFLNNQFDETPTKFELLSMINSDLSANISEQVLDIYLLDFENKCNQTITVGVPEDKPIKVSYFTILIIIIIISVFILILYNKRTLNYVVRSSNKNSDRLSELLERE